MFDVLKCAPCPPGMISTLTPVSTSCTACAEPPTGTRGDYYRDGESRIFFDKARFISEQSSEANFLINHTSFGLAPSDYRVDDAWADDSYAFVSIIIDNTNFFKGFYRVVLNNSTQITLTTPTLWSKSAALTTMPPLVFEFRENFSKLVWTYNQKEFSVVV